MNIKQISWVFAVFGLLAMGWGGIVYYKNIYHTLLRSREEIIVHKLSSIAFEMNQEATQARNAVSWGADSGQGLNVLWDSTPESLERANALCDTLSHSLNPSTVFLMDASGGVVASSNRDQPNSFIGRNYSFRPYFQGALKGEGVTYLARGVTSKKNGIYYSEPVLYKDRVAGVLVLKLSMELLKKKFAELSYSGEILLVSKEGVIFSSTRPEWDLKTLFPKTSSEKEALIQVRQFGNGPFDDLGLKKTEDSNPFLPSSEIYVLPNQQNFVFNWMDIDSLPGWRLNYLHDIGKTRNTLVAPLARHALASIAPGLVIICGLSLFLFISILKAVDKEDKLVVELQDKIREVSTLRGILPICCYCKKIRTDEDAWDHIEAYIADHSDAEFSHGICPECMALHYPDLEDDEIETE